MLVSDVGGKTALAPTGRTIAFSHVEESILPSLATYELTSSVPLGEIKSNQTTEKGPRRACPQYQAFAAV